MQKLLITGADGLPSGIILNSLKFKFHWIPPAEKYINKLNTILKDFNI